MLINDCLDVVMMEVGCWDWEGWRTPGVSGLEDPGGKVCFGGQQEWL